MKSVKMTYKVTTNYADKDFYTDSKEEALKVFAEYVNEWNDGIRLYEADKSEGNDDEPIEWDIIESFDADDYYETYNK
jgi:hypothetical protein